MSSSGFSRLRIRSATLIQQPIPFTATAVTGSTDRKMALLGVKPNQTGVEEYVTTPCFATARNNLHGPANMDLQPDLANAHNLTVTPGVIHYFGCWLDVNQPHSYTFPPHPQRAIGTGHGQHNGQPRRSCNPFRISSFMHLINVSLLRSATMMPPLCQMQHLPLLTSSFSATSLA